MASDIDYTTLGEINNALSDTGYWRELAMQVMEDGVSGDGGARPGSAAGSVAGGVWRGGGRHGSAAGGPSWDGGAGLAQQQQQRRTSGVQVLGLMAPHVRPPLQRLITPAVRDAASLQDHYWVLDEIGSGGFGRVFRAVQRGTSLPVCIKQVNTSRMSPFDAARQRNEAKALAALHHPNIVCYLDCFMGDGSASGANTTLGLLGPLRDGAEAGAAAARQVHGSGGDRGGSGSSSGDGMMHLVMEWCEGGDLAGHLRAARREGRSLSEDEVMSKFVQVCMALEHIHSKGIMHRDLKVSNIFLAGGGLVKVGDFGICKILSDDAPTSNHRGAPSRGPSSTGDSVPQSRRSSTGLKRSAAGGSASASASPDLSMHGAAAAWVSSSPPPPLQPPPQPRAVLRQRRHSFVGTPNMLSPEMCRNKPYGQKADVWALGCILYEMVALKPAFKGTSAPNIFARILRGSAKPLPPGYSAALQRLLDAMLAQDPAVRPTAAALLQDDFVRPYVERIMAKLRHQQEQQQQDLQPAASANTASPSPPLVGGAAAAEALLAALATLQDSAQGSWPAGGATESSDAILADIVQGPAASDADSTAASAATTPISSAAQQQMGALTKLYAVSSLYTPSSSNAALEVHLPARRAARSRHSSIECSLPGQKLQEQQEQQAAQGPVLLVHRLSRLSLVTRAPPPIPTFPKSAPPATTDAHTSAEVAPGMGHSVAYHAAHKSLLQALADRSSGSTSRATHRPSGEEGPGHSSSEDEQQQQQQQQQFHNDQLPDSQQQLQVAAQAGLAEAQPRISRGGSEGGATQRWRRRQSDGTAELHRRRIEVSHSRSGEAPSPHAIVCNTAEAIAAAMAADAASAQQDWDRWQRQASRSGRSKGRKQHLGRSSSGGTGSLHSGGGAGSWGDREERWLLACASASCDGAGAAGGLSCLSGEPSLKEVMLEGLLPLLSPRQSVRRLNMPVSPSTLPPAVSWVSVASLSCAPVLGASADGGVSEDSPLGSSTPISGDLFTKGSFEWTPQGPGGGSGHSSGRASLESPKPAWHQPNPLVFGQQRGLGSAAAAKVPTGGGTLGCATPCGSSFTSANDGTGVSRPKAASAPAAGLGPIHAAAGACCLDDGPALTSLSACGDAAPAGPAAADKGRAAASTVAASSTRVGSTLGVQQVQLPSRSAGTSDGIDARRLPTTPVATQPAQRSGVRSSSKEDAASLQGPDSSVDSSCGSEEELDTPASLSSASPRRTLPTRSSSTIGSSISSTHSAEAAAAAAAAVASIRDTLAPGPAPAATWVPSAAVTADERAVLLKNINPVLQEQLRAKLVVSKLRARLGFVPPPNPYLQSVPSALHMSFDQHL